MKKVLFIFAILTGFLASAQFKTNVTATGKHKYMMGEPKRTKAQIKARKQQLETYKRYMDIKEMYKYSYDSAKVIYVDSIYQQKKYPIKYKTDSIWSSLPGTMRYNFKPTPDSLFVSQKVLASGNLPPEAAKYLANPPNKPSVGQVKAQIEDYKNYQKVQAKYESRYDSVKVDYIDSIYLKQRINVQYRGEAKRWKQLPNNLVYPFQLQDSLTVSKRVLNSGEFNESEIYYLSYPPPNPKTMLLDRVDSTAYSEGRLKELMSVFAGDLPTAQNPSLSSSFGDSSNPNMLSQDQAQQQMILSDPKELAKQQAKDRLMKKKFSSMPDQRNPEEGTKRSSLEDAPAKSRIYVGGMLSIESTDPFIIDFTLQVGYWLNKNWLAGVGIGIREKFGNDASAIAGDSWGNSLFTRYNLPKNFFAYSEFQRQINQSLLNKKQNSEIQVKPEWQEAYLLGVGRDFNLGFVNMMLILLYDFNWRNNDLYSQPFNTRIGFQLTKKPQVGEKE